MAQPTQDIDEPPPLLLLPAETRLMIYQFTQSQNNNIKSKITSLRPTRCFRSQTHPLLGVCSTLRTEYLSYLLSTVTLNLSCNVRPRARSRALPLPIWQLYGIQHIKLSSQHLRLKMQFELFPCLRTLTLEWGTSLRLLLSADARQSPQTNTSSMLESGNGVRTTQESGIDHREAIIALAQSVLKSAPEPWIRKLIGRKQKRFELRLDAFMMCIDNDGCTFQEPREVVVDVDNGRFISVSNAKEPVTPSKRKNRQK